MGEGIPESDRAREQQSSVVYPLMFGEGVQLRVLGAIRPLFRDHSHTIVGRGGILILELNPKGIFRSVTHPEQDEALW